jgi:glutathione synthase/RimK-type ligase-like ATP-grasp enzyme
VQLSPTIALVTSRDSPSSSPDDESLRQGLATLGILSHVAAWDDAATEWGQFDLLILRSCWNYHLKPLAFLCWLGSLRKRRVPVLNSQFFNWNLSKTYLLDLARRGVAIPPTEKTDSQDSRTLAEIMTEHGWKEVVVKPTVSASAYETWRVTQRGAVARAGAFRRLRCQRELLVQKFLPEVATCGELSFVFLGGSYSHAVLKTAQAGDFRVQTDFGGSRSLARPGERLIEQAVQILHRAAPEAAYARVDAVEVDRQLVLMELELIDPVLFLSYETDAGSRFATAIEVALQ